MNDTLKNSLQTFLSNLEAADLTNNEKNGVLREVLTVLHKKGIGGAVDNYVLACGRVEKGEDEKTTVRAATTIVGFNEVVPRLTFELLKVCEKDLPEQTLLAMLNHIASYQDERVQQQQQQQQQEK